MLRNVAIWRDQERGDIGRIIDGVLGDWESGQLEGVNGVPLHELFSRRDAVRSLIMETVRFAAAAQMKGRHWLPRPR